MSEEKIFEFLLPRQYDFPKLHSEAAEIIASNFTNIIYDSLKLKSSAATAKRLDIIKFFKTLASSPDKHVTVDETNYSCFIESFKNCYFEGSDADLSMFFNENRAELLEKIPKSLCGEVTGFYKRKNEKHKKKIKALELIKKCDQDALNRASFRLKVTKKISYYATSDSVITNILINKDTLNFSQDANQNCTVNNTGKEYRNKQIKFAYALLNLNEWKTLELVLNRLAQYQNLTNLEINFLIYLNVYLNGDGDYLRQFLFDHFVFIYEKYLIEVCTKIIKLEKPELPTFFNELLLDKSMQIIKALCTDNLVKLKFTHLLYELYTCSYCNINLLKFIDLFE